MKLYRATPRGFTFIEILVVVAIIAILATAGLAVYQEARKKSHDTQRTSDISQLQVALRVYRDASGLGFPTYAGGELIGDGVNLDATLAPYLAGQIRDPLYGSSGYAYYYDSDYSCGGTSHTILVALTVEQAANKNWSAVCGGTDEIISGVTPSANSYVVILK